MKARFGSAGVSESFKGKNVSELKDYLISLGLSAYEIQCGRGVRMSFEKARLYGSEFKGISLSIHAPYYISLSSIEKEKRVKSVEYILQTAKLANLMGARKIVVHTGSCGKISRVEALNLAKSTIKKAVQVLKNENLQNVVICLETMGKTNQLGGLEEVLELCSEIEEVVPCVDFGHLYARSFGELESKQNFIENLGLIGRWIGETKLKNIHMHFSKVAFTVPGGEKKHLSLKNDEFGPDFNLLAEAIVEKNLTPTIICESCEAQELDASVMKQIYEEKLKKMVM